MRKVFVCVNADFDINGNIIPLSFIWDDGHKYDVDRVLDIRPAASLKVGGVGTRYTCRICGRQVFMFYDDFDKKWFMEGQDSQ